MQIKKFRSAHSFRLFIFLLLSPCVSHATDDAQFTFRCDGLPGLTLKATSHNTNTNGVGQATMQPVQFNILTPAKVNSTIFVDDKNSPTCAITISDKYTITGVGASFLANGSWTSPVMWQPEPAPHDIDKALVVTPRLLNNQTIQVTMSHKGDTAGNTTVAFVVNYIADKK